MSGQLYLPESYIQEQHAWLRQNGLEHLLPSHAQRAVHILRSRADIEAFDQLRGRAAMPVKHVVLYGPDGRTPIVIPTAGTMEAAEIQDVALGVWEKAERKLEQGKPIVDFDEMRAAAGMVERERFHDAFAEAVEEKIKEQQRSHRTNPGPQIDKPRGIHAT